MARASHREPRRHPTAGLAAVTARRHGLSRQCASVAWWVSGTGAGLARRVSSRRRQRVRSCPQVVPPGHRSRRRPRGAVVRNRRPGLTRDGRRSRRDGSAAVGVLTRRSVCCPAGGSAGALAVAGGENSAGPGRSCTGRRSRGRRRRWRASPAVRRTRLSFPAHVTVTHRRSAPRRRLPGSRGCSRLSRRTSRSSSP